MSSSATPHSKCHIFNELLTVPLTRLLCMHLLKKKRTDDIHPLGCFIVLVMFIELKSTVDLCLANVQMTR